MLFLSKQNKLNRKWAFGIRKIQLVVRTLQIKFFLLLVFYKLEMKDAFSFKTQQVEQEMGIWNT